MQQQYDTPHPSSLTLALSSSRFCDHMCEMRESTVVKEGITCRGRHEDEEEQSEEAQKNRRQAEVMLCPLSTSYQYLCPKASCSPVVQSLLALYPLPPTRSPPCIMSFFG